MENDVYDRAKINLYISDNISVGQSNKDITPVH